jgi:hypothetical protein
MSKSNDFSWELGLVLFLFVSAWLFRQLRFLFHRFGSYKWPSVPATVQKGSLGTVAVGRSWHAASFLGYEYLVEGVRYTGFFVLYGDKELVGQLNESLAGKSIQIRYDPTDLGSSFLASDFNPLFKGLSADQDPDLLRQGLPFDIKSTFGIRLDR